LPHLPHYYTITMSDECTRALTDIKKLKTITMKKFILVGAIASLLIAQSTFAFTGTPNDGAHFFVQDGHRVFGHEMTANLVGKIFPEQAIHYYEQKTLCRIFGNTCSINMVGKIPTPADIAAIKVHRCTTVYPGARVID
jgi:hypothetical protein